MHGVTDVPQTYTVSIPSCGLALMAMRLAEKRTGATLLRPDGVGQPIVRDRLYALGPWPASSEYYRIIDRIARGEQP